MVSNTCRESRYLGNLVSILIDLRVTRYCYEIWISQLIRKRIACKRRIQFSNLAAHRVWLGTEDNQTICMRIRVHSSARLLHGVEKVDGTAWEREGIAKDKDLWERHMSVRNYIGCIQRDSAGAFSEGIPRQGRTGETQFGITVLILYARRSLAHFSVPLILFFSHCGCQSSAILLYK